MRVARFWGVLVVASIMGSSALAQEGEPSTIAESESDDGAAVDEESAGDREARARFEAGRALVQVGSYDAARLEFQRGYELSERPLFIFNMAECTRQLGNPEDARREYSEYIRQDPGGTFAVTARTRLQELGEGDTSTPDFIVALNAPPPPESTELLVLEVPTEPQPRPIFDDPPEQESRPWFKSWPFWTAVGAVVVGGIVAGIVLGTRGGNDCTAGCQELDWTSL